MPLLSQMLLVIIGLGALSATLVAAMAISDFTDGEGEVLFIGLVVSLIFWGVVVPLVVGDVLAKTLGPTDIGWFKSFLFTQLLLEPIVYFVGYVWVLCFNTTLKAI